MKVSVEAKRVGRHEAEARLFSPGKDTEPLTVEMYFVYISKQNVLL